MLKLTAIGHLGKEAIINNVNGKQVINFSVAHTEKLASNNEQKEKTVWVDCAYWSDSKVVPYLKKGTQVYVEGTPEARSFQRNDGTPGSSLSLRVREIQLLGGKSDSSVASSSAPAMAAAPSAGDMTDASDDLPF